MSLIPTIRPKRQPSSPLYSTVPSYPLQAMAFLAIVFVGRACCRASSRPCPLLTVPRAYDSLLPGAQNTVHRRLPTPTDCGFSCAVPLARRNFLHALSGCWRNTRPACRKIARCSVAVLSTRNFLFLRVPNQKTTEVLHVQFFPERTPLTAPICPA